MAILPIGRSTTGCGYQKTLTTYKAMRNLEQCTVKNFKENGVTTYRECIIEGVNYIKRLCCTFDKEGKAIKGSRFSTLNMKG